MLNSVLPTIVFFAGIVLCPLFLTGDRESYSLSPRNWPLETPAAQARLVEEAMAYLGDPAMLGAWAFLVVALLLGAFGGAKLSCRDRRASLWDLLNGAFIHVAMDGLTGGFHLLPLMDAHYRQLDNRCNDDVSHAAGGPSEDAVATATVVFRVELFVMAPLCLLTYLAYRGCSLGLGLNALRPELEISTLLFQICGTIWFVGPELLTGCKNMVPIGIEGCTTVGTKPYELMYFWFAVGVNVVWIIVPLLMLRHTVQQNVSARAITAGGAHKGGKSKRA